MAKLLELSDGSASHVGLRTSTVLSPAPSIPSSQRLSARSLLRRAWRPRSSSIYNQDRSLSSLAENTKGALGLNLLHEPAEPRVDFVFVHGLHGGSRKTWSFDQQVSTFWPAQWLPLEPGFSHARIHSFGYDADWSRLQHSPLRIRDFAQALLASISNSQTLKRNGDSPIVLVAHSMGGLVVKQAYLLARRDPTYSDLAPRFHSIYFLATPHRGADAASFVKAYLSVSMPLGSKSYVEELLPDSTTVQDINDDFRHVCTSLHLWSFYEGIPTAGVMIVKKSSAVIGLPTERTQFIAADHRHICKFHDVTDPNYRTLVDCFKTTLEQIEHNSVARQREQMKVIAKALDIDQRPADDLLNIEERRHRGTCEWLTTDAGFQAWLNIDRSDASPNVGLVDGDPVHRYFWLNGPPGSGKSVAAGHVINHLASCNLDCSYFFFKHDSSATFSQLLLSLAFQMAESNGEIRQVFLDFLQNGSEVNTHDHTAIWRTIFLGCLFKTSFSQPQYWVIDALDECPKKSLKTLVQRFNKIDPTVPLRIFITGRPGSSGAALRQLLDDEKIERFELETGKTGSLMDIAAYMRSQPRLSNLLSEERSGISLSDVLDKTKGIFLWASLIVSRLDEVYSIEDIRKVLDEVPSEMNGFYQRILDSLTRSPNAEKAQCILRWVVCAPEPLTTEEVKEIVRIDIGHTLIAPESNDIFSEICGSLVTVHKDEGSRVQLVHQTVKEFLTSSASNFYVHQHQAHEHIASVCLEYMTGPNGLRRAARRPTAVRSRVTSIFTDYASSNFSYHLSHSHSTDSALMSALVQFISTKSLVWIETIAKKGNLNLFHRVIRNLKPYLARQLEKRPPCDKNYQTVSSWIHDLSRLVDVFGRALVQSPDAIYAFIPPLCPKSSFLHQTFAGASPLKVICSLRENWEERMSCVVLPAAAKCVASSGRYLAVGLANGTVKLLDSSTLEEATALEHGKPVRRVAFGNISTVLASLSPNLLTLWDSQQRRIWSAPIAGVASSIAFSTTDSVVYVTLKGEAVNPILSFKAKDGSRLEPLVINADSSDEDSDSDDTHMGPERYCLDVISLAPQLGRAATTHRSSHLTVYSLDDQDNLEKLCVIQKKGYETAARPPQILSVVFNPVIESDLMAVSYIDGDIVTIKIDDWSQQQTAKYYIHAWVLASSADGRTLAAGDTRGDVALFTFDTLQLVHRISLIEEAVKGIVFASNNIRLYDIRGRSCNIWEPAVLVRDGLLGDSSSDVGEPMSAAACDKSAKPLTYLFEGNRVISAMTPAGDESFSFCGREDGSVTVHDVKKGDQVLELKPHAVDIHHLAWHPSSGLLVSVDISRHCIGTRLSTPSGGSSEWCRLEQVFNFKAAGRILQTIIRPDGLAVLVSTECGEDLWQDDKVSASTHSVGSGRWMLHPADSSGLLLFDGGKVHLHQWEGLGRQSPAEGVSLSLTEQTAEDVQQVVGNIWIPRSDSSMLVQAVQLQDRSTICFLTLDVAHIQSDTASVDVFGTVRTFVDGIKEILTVTRSSIIFLGRDGWICSLNVRSLQDTQFYTRHFFVPPFWRAGGNSLIRMLSKNSLAIAYRDDLVIVQGVMDFSQKVYFEEMLDEGRPIAYRSLTDAGVSGHPAGAAGRGS